MRLQPVYISNDQHVFTYESKDQHVFSYISDRHIFHYSEAELETDPATGKRLFEGGVFNQDGTFEATGAWDS